MESLINNFGGIMAGTGYIKIVTAEQKPNYYFEMKPVIDMVKPYMYTVTIKDILSKSECKMDLSVKQNTMFKLENDCISISNPSCDLKMHHVIR